MRHENHTLLVQTVQSMMWKVCKSTCLRTYWSQQHICHYDDVKMTMLASQLTSLTVVYSIVYSGVNQRKHQSSASLAFVREIHRGPVNFPHKWPVTRKMFPFDDVIMQSACLIKPRGVDNYNIVNTNKANTAVCVLLSYIPDIIQGVFTGPIAAVPANHTTKLMLKITKTTML